MIFKEFWNELTKHTFKSWEKAMEGNIRMIANIFNHTTLMTDALFKNEKIKSTKNTPKK